MNKITTIIKSKDPIMKNIISNMDKYKILTVNAVINKDIIIPGISGCIVDVDESYENMKKINEYNSNLLKYKDLIPEITISNIYNKYITKGNSHNRRVSIVINIKDSIDKSLSIANTNQTKLNIFLDSELLKNGAIDINNKYVHIYNGGTNNNYDDITVEWMNDVINDSYNNSSYCINKDKNDNNLLICARNRMHSIYPTIVINNSNTYKSKTLITNGSIVFLEGNDINNLTSIISYIKGKGYNIVYLNELLEEKTCNK